MEQVRVQYDLKNAILSYSKALDGIDEWIVRRALSILDDIGKVVIYPGTTSDEDGVKFLAAE